MSKTIKIIIGLAIIGILTAVYVWFFVYNKPHMDVAHAKADFSLPAGQLYSEFKQDKDANSLKYNGKVLEISGQLSKIEEADTLMTAVFVFEQGMFGDQGVRCALLPDQFEKAKSITPDSPVTVKGYCTGFNDTDVILEKVSFVEQ